MTLDRGGFIAATAGALVAQNLATLRVLSFPSDAAKQILYPMQAGIFRKHGVQIDLSSMGGGAAIIAAVVGGSAEFGAGSLFPVFTAYGHGIPVRMVAPISIYDTDRCDTWLLVRSDSGIHTPQDLNGKTMAADSPTDIYVIATQVWMDQHGGDGKSIRAVGMNAGEQLAALQQGRIDVVMLKPPFLTVAMRSGRVRVLGKPLDVIAPRFLVSCWVATTDYIAKNPEAVTAFVAGVMEGARYTNRHQDATVDMVAQFSKQDPAQIKAGVRTVLAETLALPYIQRPLDFAYKYGVIDKQYDARVLLSSFVPLSRA
jgi:NitT/TauT family transport system substrate-binding protein